MSPKMSPKKFFFTPSLSSVTLPGSALIRLVCIYLEQDRVLLEGVDPYDGDDLSAHRKPEHQHRVVHVLGLPSK